MGELGDIAGKLLKPFQYIRKFDYAPGLWTIGRKQTLALS